jgi:hypothetical protein
MARRRDEADTCAQLIGPKLKRVGWAEREIDQGHYFVRGRSPACLSIGRERSSAVWTRSSKQTIKAHQLLQPKSASVDCLERPSALERRFRGEL